MSVLTPVTVIIPCYNQGRFLVDCIGSLERQTHSAWRAIIVDDASTDGETPTLCDQFQSDKVTVVHLSQNRGLPGARREAIARAETEVLMNLDADDALEPEHLATTVPLLMSNPKCGVVYTDNLRFGASTGIMSGRPFDPILLYTYQYIFACSLYRKSAHDTTAGYRPELRMGNEDWDFWISVIEAGFTGIYVPKPLYRYRCHAASWTSQPLPARAIAVRTSRDMIRDFHREGYTRAGKLEQFDRDTDVICGRYMMTCGDLSEARKCFWRALKKRPLSMKTALLLLRSFVARPAK